MYERWIHDLEVTGVRKKGKEADELFARDGVGRQNLSWRRDLTKLKTSDAEILDVKLQPSRREAVDQALGLRARLDDELPHHAALGLLAPDSRGERQCLECAVLEELLIRLLADPNPLRARGA